MPSESMWLHFLQNAGFAAVILLAVGIALWKTGAWAGKKADDWIAPLVKAHLEFIAKLEKKQESQTAILQTQTSVLQSIQLQQTAQTQAIAQQASATTKMIERLESMENIKVSRA